MSLGVLVLLPDQPQTRQRQKLLDMLDVFRPARHQPRLATCGHHGRLSLQFRLDAREHPVHQIHPTVVQTGLHVRHGVRADHLAGILDFTRGKRAALVNSASDEIPSPGAIAPPTYSHFAEITSKVMAVPKSTTMHGPPNL